MNQTATHSAIDPNLTTGGASDPTAAALPTSGDRYRLGEEIARGGMGAVYRATDTALGREVAVKVLLDRFAPHSGTARRFDDEARITGQLQHPGIPPVYDVGTLPDGRPFLAMKLIKGETLDELLKRRPASSTDRGRWLGVFEKICEAVAYAHAHDVIHRDLKPQNVMVGAFGEVQVMDWGLAKVLTVGREEEPSDPNATAAGTAIVSQRDSDDLLTQAGSVLGTPAYMPPEQAIGAIDQIDRQSDVFGLGGILSAILTGRPPFEGPTAESTRQMAAKGKLADCFERLDGSGAELELVALCKRCLAGERADRPADAKQVADEVAVLRAAAEERARQAELDKMRVEGEKAAADVRAAERRKRRMVWGGAAAALIAASIGGLVTVLVVQDRASRRLEAKNKELADARAEVDARNQALVAEKAEVESQADASAERVRFLLRNTIETLRRLGLRDQIADLTEFVGKDLERLARVTGENVGIGRRAKVSVLLALVGYEREQAVSAATPAEKNALQERAETLVREAVAVADELSRIEPDSDLNRSNLALALSRRGLTALDRGRREAAAEDIEAGLKLRQELVDSPRSPPGTVHHCYPADAWASLAESCFQKGTLLRRGDRAADAVTWFERATAAGEKALTVAEAAAQRDGKWSVSSEGLTGFRRALANLYQTRASLLSAEPMAALEFARKAVVLRERVLTDNPRSVPDRLDLADAQATVGDLCLFLRRPADAVEPYRQHMAHLTRATSPTDTRNQWAMAYYRAGAALKMANQPADARAQFEKCLAVREEVAGNTPTSEFLQSLMIAQARAGRSDAAVTTARRLAEFPQAEWIEFNIGAARAILAEAVGEGAATADLTPDQQKARAAHLNRAWEQIEKLARTNSRLLGRAAVDLDYEYLQRQPDFKTRFEAIRAKHR